MAKKANQYDEVFSTEIEGWCYGIAHFPGEVTAALVHRVLKELSASFQTALEQHVQFDMIEVATKFSRAAKYLVPESEVAFSILAQLPNPALLDEGAQYILAQLVDQVERTYGGALEPLQKKWIYEREKILKARKAA
jgi:hypothetical protein